MMIAPSSSSNGRCLACSLAANSECDGKRPSCSRCAEAGALCRWALSKNKRGRKPGISKKRMLELYRKSSYQRLRKACTTCSDLKRRCDSQKPSCSFCRTRQLHCEYGSYKSKLSNGNLASVRKAAVFQIFHRMDLSALFGENDQQAISIFLAYCEETLPAFSPSLYLRCIDQLENEPQAETTPLCLVLLQIAIACGAVLGGFNSHLQGFFERIDSALLLLASHPYNKTGNRSDPILGDKKTLLDLHLDLFLDFCKCQPYPRSDDVLLTISSMLNNMTSGLPLCSAKNLATVKAIWHWNALTLHSRPMSSNSDPDISSGCPPCLTSDEMACFPAACQAFFRSQTVFLSLPLFTGVPLHASDTLDNFCSVLDDEVYAYALHAADHITLSKEGLVSHQFIVANLFCAVLEIVTQGQAQAGLARCNAITRRLEENAALLAPGTVLLHLAAPSWAAPLQLLAHILWLGGRSRCAERVAALHDAAAAARGLPLWAWPPAARPRPGRALGPAASGGGPEEQTGTVPPPGRLRALVALGLALRGEDLADQRGFLYGLCAGAGGVPGRGGGGGGACAGQGVTATTNGAAGKKEGRGGIVKEE